MASRDKAVEGFRKSLDPLRLTLRTQAYLGGAAPNYADYIVFGAFQWARVVSPFKLLDGRRSGLCLARAAARRVRRHGAEVAKGYQRGEVGIGRAIAAALVDSRNDDVRWCKSAGNDCGNVRPIAEAVN